ncbi:MAG: TerC family protein [Alphaproteobacteria bacterium]|jgi:YjbE family integral membrane protein|nr:TerC family protein [Alphaproteobacteria bacterium]
MMEIILDIIQIIFVDIVLSGDNALVIGMAAAGLAPKDRQRAIFFGMAAAAGLRIVFAVTATYLLKLPGILLVGAALLAWVCWRFYNDLKEFNSTSPEEAEAKMAQANAETGTGDDNSFRRALVTILMADVSMSIDNIIAVAAIAHENVTLLVFGLGLAIAMMAFFAQLIMRIMLKYKWLSWLGLVLLIYLTFEMLYKGLVKLEVIAPLAGV